MAESWTKLVALIPAAEHIACLFVCSLKHIAFVDLGIPSLGAEWVPGHHEDLGMTDVSNSTDSLELVSDGKIHKML